ncbi:ABC transporter ATP-binding protein [Klugiella xanthotipulae]|uniref:Putative ABC transport system ATP-binding protein n=1 Tax=Klugiella xanthotipulae TaxID=244735 RepID=A0A543I3U0_9MICO|nr:ABC transporter ATP-binding protein [Klugiella xanthotipulae]TQM65262.1 putative ABC transport system ATP-binding protein [Klugiella xanthotipulae]
MDTPSSATAISAVNVRKTYGKKENAFHALRGVSLDIRQGESIAIVGKSGSGKSTLMHLLALLDTPDEGSIRLDDRDVSSLRAVEVNKMRNSYYGFVFQQFFLNGRQSVLDNVMLPLVIGGVRPAERKKRARAALEAVGLSDKIKNRANDLSGGQKQRVVIARALVNEPRIIFADEPTGNLDTHTGEQVEQMLFDLNKQKGITLVVVTHDPEFAARFDRQIFLSDGQIVSESGAAA